MVAAITSPLERGDTADGLPPKTSAPYPPPPVANLTVHRTSFPVQAGQCPPGRRFLNICVTFVC